MNALQQQELTYQTKSLQQFQPIAELARIRDYLEHAAKLAKGRGKTVMFINIRTGRLDHKSLHHFILKGLPRKFRGFEQILKDENYEVRFKALQLLEAYTRILSAGQLDGLVVTQFESITGAMLQAKMADIKANKHLYR
jgi:hypothetical protein